MKVQGDLGGVYLNMFVNYSCDFVKTSPIDMLIFGEV